MTEGKLYPRDKNRMQPGMEYAYVSADIDYGTMRATVRIVMFDLESTQESQQQDVTQHDLALIVARLKREGWDQTASENGREYELYFFRRRQKR